MSTNNEKPQLNNNDVNGDRIVMYDGHELTIAKDPGHKDWWVTRIDGIRLSDFDHFYLGSGEQPNENDYSTAVSHYKHQEIIGDEPNMDNGLSF